MDGVNGYEFVQTKSEGVPVLVNPILLPNEAKDLDLRQRDYIMDGVNGYEFLQTKTNGVPLSVNPESMMDTNEYSAKAVLGFGVKVGEHDLKLNQKPQDSVVL